MTHSLSDTIGVVLHQLYQAEALAELVRHRLEDLSPNQHDIEFWALSVVAGDVRQRIARVAHILDEASSQARADVVIDAREAIEQATATKPSRRPQ